MAERSIPSGFYPDPLNPSVNRRWNGNAWERRADDSPEDAELVHSGELPRPFESTSRTLDDDSGTDQSRLRAPANPRITTLPTLPGFTIVDVKGVVFASTSTVGWKAQAEDAGFWNKQEIRLEHATRESFEKLWTRAERQGANAVVGVVFAANNAEGRVAGLNSSAVVLMGTAVVVAQDHTSDPQPSPLVDGPGA